MPLTLVLCVRWMKQRYSCENGKSKLNHLLFINNLKFYGSNQNDKIDSLVKTVDKDNDKGHISMRFVIDNYLYKCGVLTMKRGREVECDGIGLENGEEIGRVGEGRYKCN